MNVKLPLHRMSRNNLEASTCKMTEPFNFEKNESKLPPHDSLRSPGGHPNHPNFRLKSPENGNKKNNFLLCEQTKQYVASQEDNSVSSNPNCISGEVVRSKGDRKTLPTGNTVSPLGVRNNSPPKEVNNKPSNNVSPAKSKKIHKLVENSLSINNPALFNSLRPPLRSTTCHLCGLFGTYLGIELLSQKGSLRCSQCKQTYYCSIACQRGDWSAHSIVCKPVQQNFHKLEDNKSPFETKNMEVKNEGDCSLGVTKEITVCADKTMFSDLRPLQLRKTMEIKGTVTEFKHPSDFYVQLYSSEVIEYMNQLSASLKEIYANAQEEDYVPVKGEVCVAKYSVDQTWNRVIIQDVDVLQKKAQVLYIDYGNEEIIPVNRIHQLTRNIDLFPPCAIKCFVASVIPAEGNWSNDCIKTIKSLLMEQYCFIKIVDILKEEVVTFAVDVMLPNSGKLLDHVLVEMGYGLIPKGPNSKKQSEDQCDPEDAGKMTAENKIVVDRSDLIPKVLTLNIGDEFCGVVSHIQTPEDFFCQKLQNGHKLAELQASLSEYCGRVSPRSDFYPTIGDICCAQFSEDDQWYRASVLAYASEESVLVGYVDYGNFEILSLKRLCSITPKLLELPMQAIKCVLAGVKPSLGIWTPEAVCLMKKIVQNKIITVKVTDKLENSSLVELVDKSVTPSVRVTQVLIDAGFAVGEKGIVTDKSSDTKEASVPLGAEAKLNPPVWTWVGLAIDQTVDVVVCMIYSPGEFYCHVLKEDALQKLNDLNKSLAEYCQQKLSKDFKAEIGQPCCAFFAGDGSWYRAVVKEIVPNGNVRVHFVDYGNIEEVTADELQMLPTKFLKLPFQGVQCWLVDIQPRNKHWTKEAIARFQTCVAGIKLQARVVEVTENGVGIELTDLSTSYPRIISDVLIDEHLVLKTNSPQKDLLKSRPVNKHDLQSDGPGCQANSSAVQWRTIELPVNKTVQARILEIINPNLFYALPNEMPEDQEKLCMLTAKLLEHCNAQESQSSYRPRAGDACCAKYTNDDFWYRAIVLGTSDAEVKVLYADYGNIETLPLCRVRPISASHLELPVQIIKCSFEGLMELNGSCSQLIIELLKNFMLNQNVMLSVKGVVKNVHTVSVEKCSGNGAVSIADKLVMYGLAKNITSKKQTTSYKEKMYRMNCCCVELQKQVEKHEQILLFLLNNPTNQNKFIEMKKLLKS
ncbi:tudor domain-containing protein 1 isoform X1 [Rousettus aegyptiacus]|uniref:tudor domain-containing protein 1 isoform X1 n=2 Tax=Rousettus aegyptiacus TaxID=9407 RepID=UPI00168CB457|nr:tudor domain-containing protein 1 isoform X1 [Rousettus aegyptiacus]XP_036079357.1 tudor domain-containing protein 1 isoform X1 [Rousettus aegyptiacus]XP_036079358.1 tudor domain-containing protein 1 isoform X1 [Rousettus aegyptiacus]XP_036079359.1 tudor domain-containing protein 1 isoform X1 [Rousettus aegyptiacus]XP_036079360.1 tudor domain-containing protein 1 isoform X1 [Rousettus aegyptiacus]XP_036079361.1 tudor domain-containing protein 1 isoform X1 [Rousettus aegyptiacus]